MYPNLNKVRQKLMEFYLKWQTPSSAQNEKLANSAFKPTFCNQITNIGVLYTLNGIKWVPRSFHEMYGTVSKRPIFHKNFLILTLHTLIITCSWSSAITDFKLFDHLFVFFKNFMFSSGFRRRIAPHPDADYDGSVGDCGLLHNLRRPKFGGTFRLSQMRTKYFVSG